jgi:hypothetical protein
MIGRRARSCRQQPGRWRTLELGEVRHGATGRRVAVGGEQAQDRHVDAVPVACGCDDIAGLRPPRLLDVERRQRTEHRPATVAQHERHGARHRRTVGGSATERSTAARSYLGLPGPRAMTRDVMDAGPLGDDTRGHGR